jgi:hypothetical protein
MSGRRGIQMGGDSPQYVPETDWSTEYLEKMTQGKTGQRKRHPKRREPTAWAVCHYKRLAYL